MSREKYLANIDRVLEKVVREASSDIGSKKMIAYSEEMEQKGEILKVAFDVFRVESDPYDGLWIMEDVNGSPHLVRANDPQYEYEKRGKWTVVSNYDKNNITLSYNKFPIAGFSSEKYGYSSEDIIMFKEALLENISEDDSFVSDVLNEQPESKRLALAKAFPEFQKFLQG